MINVSIVGATGYTGIELIRLLMNHPWVKIQQITSESFKGKELRDIYPHLKNRFNKTLSSLDVNQIAESSEVVFTALPHGISMGIVPELIARGLKVIDLSADFRYNSPKGYELSYQPHLKPELISEAAYGLPEINKSAIQKADLIANPGCYPTASILALYPLLKEGLLSPENIIVDAKSGVSGAGRKPNQKVHFCESAGNFKAYKVGEHRHQSEIIEKLSDWSNQKVDLIFTPHLLPVKRGILATCYGILEEEKMRSDLIACYQKYYNQSNFIRIMTDNDPELKFVVGSNYLDLTVKKTGSKKIVVIAAIDNLIKGSAGQAIQNFNINQDYPETLGLENTGTYI